MHRRRAEAYTRRRAVGKERGDAVGLKGLREASKNSNTCTKREL
jgi:hypothetical protein